MATDPHTNENVIVDDMGTTNVNDISVEDYTNAVDSSATTVKVADTLPESPTSSAGDEDGARAATLGVAAAGPITKGKELVPKGPNDGGNNKKGCTTWTIIGCIVVVLAAVAAGLGVGLGMTDVLDKTSSSASQAGTTSSQAGTTSLPPQGAAKGPTRSPSRTPTNLPSKDPSKAPTSMPSDLPSTVPTLAPSPPPTPANYPANPEPSSPPSSYFNYNPNSDWGPSRWARVDTSNHWLKEFGPDGFGVWDDWHSEDLTLNICDGEERKQSPKDMVETIPCNATHEIRTKCARYPLGNDDYMVKKILPHKLSIEFKRRPCMDLNNEACLVNSPPMADYPRYASGDLIIQAYSDMHHFDIKVPSEHTINGTMFDAEIQMFHTSLVMPRMSSLGIVIRADPDAYDNPDYQIILNEFGMVYNLHALECAQKRLRERRNLRLSSLRRGATGGMNTIVEEEEEEAYLASEIKKITDRQLQFRSDNFDPYSENIMTTMFFYRYDGSITEPPCRDITWWIMKDPMVISTRQLFETKRLLFSHVDSDCTATSVHNSDQSVARPLFGLGEDRDIQYCRDGDFRSDADKGRPPGNECRP